MKKNFRQTLATIMVLIMFCSCFVVPIKAATFNDINQSGIFVKQQSGNTCTLAAAVMMVRRTALASGNSNWSNITEGSMKSTAWAPGLYYNFTYAGVSVGHATINSDIRLAYIDLLNKYPQGVVAYNPGWNSQQHAVLLTDYDATTDTFYCADPANNIAGGRIPLNSSSIKGQGANGQNDKLSVLTEYWYVKSPSVTITKVTQPTKIIYPTNGGVYKIASAVGSDKYLDFALTSNNVQIYQNCDGHSDSAFMKSQYFTLKHCGDGWYQIINVGNNYAVDVAGASSISGTNIWQWKPIVYDAQLFRFYDAGNGYCYIKSKLGTYVDVAYEINENGANVWAHEFMGSTAQKWKLVKKDVPVLDTQKPSISNVKVTDVNSNGFTISCNVSDNVGIKQVLFPVWTTEALSPTTRLEAGQDDIIYHKATLNGNTATCRINISDHNNSYGEYVCDPHIYDTSDNLTIGGRVRVQISKSCSHSYTTSTTKATLTQNGKTVTKCSVCGDVKSTTIYSPKTISLSKTEYTYNGETQSPKVTIKDSKGNPLKILLDYGVIWPSGLKLPGSYTVEVIFMGNYSGTKKLTFTIAPETPMLAKTSQSTDAIRLTWNKVTGATGYRVYQYNSKTKKYEKIKTLKGTTYRVEKLKSGTAYKFKIKAYTKDGDTIWGKATEAITVATKPATPKITKLTTSKAKASLVWSDVAGESGYQVYYSTKKYSGFKKVASYKADVTKGSKSKLTKGKKYYFKVRAYKTVGDTKVYSAWSAVKSIKIK